MRYAALKVYIFITLAVYAFEITYKTNPIKFNGLLNGVEMANDISVCKVGIGLCRETSFERNSCLLDHVDRHLLYLIRLDTFLILCKMLSEIYPNIFAH